MCERWVGDGTDCHPKFLSIIATLLPHSAGLLNRGPESPSPLSGAGSHYGILSPTATGTRTVTATQTELCLPRTPTNWLSVAPGYIIFWHPPASCGCRICTKFNPSTGQGDISISSTGCTCFLIDGSVEGQYVTHWLHLCRGVKHLDMILNNLMVRLQYCWSFGKCRVPLHCHHSQVHSTFLKLQEWSLTIWLFNIISRTPIGEGSYSSAEMQSVYSTVQPDGQMIDWQCFI